jgi:hypothetical protein
MAYVPKYEHDVFVSYAHVDDEPEPGETKGWVTTLVSCLKTKLAQKLGRSDAFSLWMDHELLGHAGVSQQITGALERTATLVVILSPGYIASSWCRREAGAFLSHLARRRESSSSQIFVVRRDKIDETEPEEFGEFTGYQFWVQDNLGASPHILGTPRPDPSDRRYYDRLNDLATELAEHLKSLRHLAQRGPEEVIPDQRPTIFIAEPTDDLDDVHDDVKRYLQQAGLRVLPDCWYPRDPGAFQRAAARDLASCEVFVQLLSGSVGKRTPDVPDGYAYLQLHMAESLGKPILQWRSEELDTGKISDARHRALLERETVLAVGIEEFKRTIKERVLKKAAQKPAKPIDAFVFVDWESEDSRLADQVCEALKQYGAGYVLPERRGTAAQIRQELERNLVECDAMIVVYGASDRGWVDEQLRQCRKAISKRERPLQAVAVFEGPPEQKERLNVNLPKMFTIDCRRGLDQVALNTFLTGLGT